MDRSTSLFVCLTVLLGCGQSEAPSDAGPLAHDGSTKQPSGASGAGSSGVSGMASSGQGGVAGEPPDADAASASPDEVPGCSAADTSADPSALHEAAREVLTAPSSCGAADCHAGAGKAQLVLLGISDLREALVEKPSCEAGSILLVDGTGDDPALNNSWLWLKLTAAADPAGILIPDNPWGMRGDCGQGEGEPYGVRMPRGTPGNELLPADDLAKVRNWICAGAPGP